MDEAVLTELRAIRSEIRALAEKVGEAATRAELEAYVRREELDAHMAAHRAVTTGWQRWVPIALSAGVLLLMLLNALGVHVVVG